MINRILIRIKVVQMLYSYLLTRSEFKIEPAPDTTSRERKYAYATYIDMLLLILQLSGHRVSSNSANPIESISRNPLKDTRLAAALGADKDIKDVIMRDNSGVSRFNPIILQLHQAVVSAEVFNDYKRKRKPQLLDDVTLWNVLLKTVIAKSQLVQDIVRKDDNYSGSAFSKGVNMAIDTLTHFNDTRALLSDAKKQLDASLKKAYELYHALLLLPVAITHEQDLRIDEAKNKFIPTEEDLNPNTRFVNNAYVKAISENPEMQEYLKSNPISWDEDYFLIKDMLDAILKSEIYREYMDAPSTDFQNDCEFWRKIIRNIILPSDALAEALENKSVYWNDDLEIMGTFVLKTIKQIAMTDGLQHASLLPIFKDVEDENFGPQLFVDAIENRETYRAYIDRFISHQWDSERLAFMDIVVLITAIAELLNFPKIPIAVTINEYIEIAKSYSTPKSGQFVNGMLYSIITYLKDEGKLLKN